MNDDYPKYFYKYRSIEKTDNPQEDYAIDALLKNKAASSLEWGSFVGWKSAATSDMLFKLWLFICVKGGICRKSASPLPI